MNRLIKTIATMALLIFITACGGGDKTNPPPQIDPAVWDEGNWDNVNWQ